MDSEDRGGNGRDDGGPGGPVDAAGPDGPADGDRFGRYRLEGLIGSGGMGDVYQAMDTQHDRVVALKLLPALFSGSAEFQERFRRESRIAARLRDPHIIPIHDFGEIDARLYIDMRLVDGGTTIATLLRDEGPLPAARAVHLVAQAAEGLDAAHGDGLIHRDVKPSNVLVTARDFVYVMDFGIAHAVGQTKFGLTMTGSTVGTIDYMAPERFVNGPVDRRVDVYALGCLLFQCLTGRPPFEAAEAPALMYAHVHGEPPRPGDLVPDVPPALDEVVVTAMAKDPDDRYPTAGAFGEAARRALGSGGGGRTRVLAGEHLTTPVPHGTRPSDPGTDDRPPPAGARPSGPAPSGSRPSGPGPSGPPPPGSRPSGPTPSGPLPAAAGPGAVSGAVGAAPTAAVHTGPTGGRPATGPEDRGTPAAPPATPPTPPAEPPASDGAGSAPSRRPGRQALLVVAGCVVIVLAVVAVLLVALREPDAPPPVASAGAAVSAPTATVTGSVPTPPTPGSLAVAPGGRIAYVANREPRVITVVDLLTGTTRRTIPVPAAPPRFIAFSADGARAYVSAYTDDDAVNVVSVIDTASGGIVAVVPVDRRPYALAVAPDQRSVWVPSHDDATIDVLDTTSLTITRRIDVAPNPHWIAFGGGRAYVANHESDLVTVLDQTTGATRTTVPVGRSPHALAVSPDGTRVAVANYDGNGVSFIDTATDRLAVTVPVGRGPQYVSYAGDGRHVYTANVQDGTVSVIDTTTSTVSGTVPVCSSPTSVVVVPPENTTARVSCLDESRLAVLRIAE
ncbi:protein kinase domain-containing protein [Actinomycetospora lemnae]|uniref:Protein kinase n=1 Tax=Actinomycetospora lemnae TaxID=3019891 RepID=A0ABT5SRZ5_9PSEU|nr:protein kinase [Actinomycetospora sp. DW7H6]MDD7964503.1 protein kinase [Actinomycetospora sp. DW7H6]